MKSVPVHPTRLQPRRECEPLKHPVFATPDNVFSFSFSFSFSPVVPSTLTTTLSPEDNLRLQEELLRLTADVGRERVEKASVAERLGQAEARVGRRE